MCVPSQPTSSSTTIDHDHKMGSDSQRSLRRELDLTALTTTRQRQQPEQAQFVIGCPTRTATAVPCTCNLGAAVIVQSSGIREAGQAAADGGNDDDDDDDGRDESHDLDRVRCAAFARSPTLCPSCRWTQTGAELRRLADKFCSASSSSSTTAALSSRRLRIGGEAEVTTMTSTTVSTSLSVLSVFTKALTALFNACLQQL